jgi:CheY-like chemotaxis protein
MERRPLPAPPGRVPGLKHVRCGDCERHIVAAERELGALVTAVSILYGSEEAHRVAKDWIEIARDRNVPLADGNPELRRLSTAAIEQLAQRRESKRISSIKRNNVPHQMRDILIVDDNMTILGVFAEILSEHGYRVRTACDGYEALAAIRVRVPDILISDLNMPRMSGFELLSIVRRHFPLIAVIAMSAEYAGAAVPQGVAADGFYAKGSSGIECLFEILLTIRDEEVRQTLRDTVPV